MVKPIVFMFSGQGSQYYQMGKELYVQNPVLRKWMFKLEQIAQEISGYSIIEELYNEKKWVGEQFNRTLYTHPAIFMLEYALAQVLLEDGVEPDYVLGASLGEFTSAAIADVMRVEELLELVIKQAQAFESNCLSGGMIAIINDFSLFWETPLIYENSELASINFDSHFVISGSTDKLKIIEEFLQSKGIIYQVLPVSYGFHSSLIDSAANDYRDFLRGRSYQTPNIPLISGVYGTQLPQLPNEYFWEIARRPINFPEAIRGLEKERRQNLIYLDLSPGGTLANFAKRNIDINSQSEVYVIMTPFNQDSKNLAKVKEKLACRLSKTKFKIGT